MSCKTSCTIATVATDCAANYSCIGGLCQKKGPGESCGNNNGALCGTGNCVDTVCCNTPSCGPCLSCNTTTPGTCAPVTAGTTDSACNATSSTMCGHDGKCDNAGNCTNWGNTTSCRQPSCLNKKTQIEAANCPGNGAACPKMVNTDCDEGYLCVGTACVTMCTADAQCDVTGGYTCDTTKHCTKPVSATGGAPGTGGMGTGGMSTGGVSGTGGDAGGSIGQEGGSTGASSTGNEKGKPPTTP